MDFIVWSFLVSIIDDSAVVYLKETLHGARSDAQMPRDIVVFNVYLAWPYVCVAHVNPNHV